MILGNEAPETAVGAVVTVVTHEPVVVHLEGVGIGFLSIDVDLAVFHLNTIAFELLDGTQIEGKCLHREVDLFALSGDMDGAEVVYRPVVALGMREELTLLITGSTAVNSGLCLSFSATLGERGTAM